jgi:F0F1-type ATP synthase assembly protein I
MTPHSPHGGGRGRGGYGYGYPLLYGYPPYIDVDDIAINFKKTSSDKSELQKQAEKLDELTKKLAQTPIIQSNLRAAIQLEIANTKNAIKKLSETSSFDGSTNQAPTKMTINSKTIAIPAVGAVAGYFIGKKFGFSPMLSALAAGVATFFISKKMMENKAAAIAASATKPDISNPASIKPADNGSTNILTSGIGSKGDSFFSYSNENLDDEILFSSVEGASGGSEASYAHNCPACMSGKNCDQPFHSDFCDKQNKLGVYKPQDGFGSAPMSTGVTGLTGNTPMKKPTAMPTKKIAPMSKGGF